MKNFDRKREPRLTSVQNALNLSGIFSIVVPGGHNLLSDLEILSTAVLGRRHLPAKNKDAKLMLYRSSSSGSQRVLSPKEA